MCSQPSRRKTPQPSEHAEAIKKALVDVAQESFFSYAEFCTPERFHEALESVRDAVDAASPRWLAAHVEFDGAFAGRVTVVVPYSLAADMTAAVAGLMPGDPIDDVLVRDATGEFANMICGTWLTRACVRRRFDLAPPAVLAVPAMPAAGRDDELVLINDWPVTLAVAFDAA